MEIVIKYNLLEKRKSIKILLFLSLCFLLIGCNKNDNASENQYNKFTTNRVKIEYNLGGVSNAIFTSVHCLNEKFYDVEKGEIIGDVYHLSTRINIEKEGVNRVRYLTLELPSICKTERSLQKLLLLLHDTNDPSSIDVYPYNYGELNVIPHNGITGFTISETKDTIADERDVSSSTLFEKYNSEMERKTYQGLFIEKVDVDNFSSFLESNNNLAIMEPKELSELPEEVIFKVTKAIRKKYNNKPMNEMSCQDVWHKKSRFDRVDLVGLAYPENIHSTDNRIKVYEEIVPYLFLWKKDRSGMRGYRDFGLGSIDDKNDFLLSELKDNEPYYLYNIENNSLRIYLTCDIRI